MNYSQHYRPQFGGFSFFPPVIKNLLIINVAVFLLQMVLDFSSAAIGLFVGMHF